jgi:D-tyrosyl-tRNA(Tyr) deacylase
MRAVIQRVTRASVSVDQVVVGSIDTGLLAFVAVADNDTAEDSAYLAGKIAKLRVFTSHGRMAKSVVDEKGKVLLISQFTLYANTRKGSRPSFSRAAQPKEARLLMETIANQLRNLAVPVETGQFGAHMEVEVVNHGPVTIILDSDDRLASRRQKP